MTTYSVPWSAYGTAEVRADSPEEAERLVLDSFRGLGSFNLRQMGVDGSKVYDAEEESW